MDKLVAIRIKYDDQTYSEQIPVSVLAENVQWDESNTLIDILGNINLTHKGNIQDQIDELNNRISQEAYSKPIDGIPKADLADSVKISLGKADTALQSYTETDPTVPAWAKQPNKPTYTAQEVGALPADSQITVEVDDTLSIQGAAADAKAVGDALDSISTSIQNIWTGRCTDRFPTITENKTVVLDNPEGFSLVNGVVIAIKYIGNSKTVSNPCLNVNGTGNIPVVAGDDSSFGNDKYHLKAWGDQGLHFFMYSALGNNPGKWYLTNVDTKMWINLIDDFSILKDANVVTAQDLGKVPTVKVIRGDQVAEWQYKDITTDNTLSVQGAPADAKKVGDELTQIKQDLEIQQSRAETAQALKINKPITNPNGTNGQILQTDGQGGTSWVDKQTDEQIANAVTDWLDDHVVPGASTIVVDDTLSISGAAADAKKTGDEITSLKEELSVLYDAQILYKYNTPAQVFPFDVTAGKNYIIKNLTPGININIRTCTSDGTEIENIKNGITPNEVVFFTPTQNASYVRVYSTGIDVYAMIGSEGVALDKLKGIDYIEKAAGLEWDVGHFINSTNGGTGNATDRACTSFIPCAENVSVSYVGENNKSTVYGLAFYDKYFKLISGDSNTGTLGDVTTLTSPVGTAYVRLSTLLSMVNDSYFRVNDAKSTTVTEVSRRAIDATIYVNGLNGNDTTGNGSLSAPYKTINKAINSGATKIGVFPTATYTETVNASERDIHLFTYTNSTSEYSDETPNRPKATISGNGTVSTALTIQGAQNVILEDIIVTGCTGDGCLINKCQNVTVTGCEFNSNGRNGVVCNYSDGVFRDCIAHDNTRDGFNLNYYGDTQFYNCSGYDNGDDGISHHQGTTGLIDGGEWYGNTKGGVASPCFGAIVDVRNVYSHDNGYGIYAHAGIATNPAVGRTFRVWNCVLTNNSQYGLSVQKNSAIIYGNKIAGNTVGQTAASVGGTITVLS